MRVVVIERTPSRAGSLPHWECVAFVGASLILQTELLLEELRRRSRQVLQPQRIRRRLLGLYRFALALARRLVHFDFVRLDLGCVLLGAFRVFFQGDGQGQVSRGLGKPRLQLQCLGIRRNRLIELESAHVDVAQVEIRLGRFQPRKTRQCKVEIRRVVSGDAFPVRVGKVRGGLGKMLMFEGPAALLVRGEKRIDQRVGFGAGRLQANA
jgi:hypothetical protein